MSESERNCIVFATDYRTGMALREMLVYGFSYVVTANSKGDTVYALYDAISFNYKDEQYPFKLAQAISYISDKPAYVRYKGKIYETDQEMVSEVENIPEPVAIPLPGMKGPGKGWAGATRDTLYSEVRKFGKFALFNWMEQYLEQEKKNTERKRVTKEAYARCKAKVNQATEGTPAYFLIDYLRNPERCVLLWTGNPALGKEENQQVVEHISSPFGEYGFKGYLINDDKSGSFICGTPTSKGQPKAHDFLLACAPACSQPGVIIKDEDNCFYKVLCADPEKEELITNSMPLNKVQLDAIFQSLYGEGCVIPETAQMKEISPLHGKEALEAKARIVMALKKNGLDAVNQILKEKAQ